MTNVSGGEGTMVERPVVTAAGLNGDPHSHSFTVPTHTHTVDTQYNPYVAGHWITYVGVAA